MNLVACQDPLAGHDHNPAGQWRWRRLGWGVPAVLLGVLLAAGCNHSAAPAKGPKVVEVIATTPITDQVTDHQEFTGRLSAVKAVEIRARVTGYVNEVPFKEGDAVKEGDLLFQIDPRSYAADLNQAKANLVLAEAERNVQERNANRAQRLLPGKAISQEDYDTMVATCEKARASVEAMRAARDRAQLYLDWTRVTAPVTGRISRRYVDPGNLVTADNTVLTSIVTEDPMYAYFDVDERTYLDLGGTTSPGQNPRSVGLQFPVTMSLANENKGGEFQFTHAGTVDFVDNQVNANTGTIRLRGVFPNPTGALKPGLFVRIRLRIGTPYPAILIPDEALLSDQGRKYVFVLNDKDEVEYRPVKIGPTIKGLRAIKPAEKDQEASDVVARSPDQATTGLTEEIMLRVIKPADKGKEGKEGLSEGERVIVTGQQQVRPKMQVQVKMQDPPTVNPKAKVPGPKPKHAAE
jgi:RND family efflux transporter MFP subunit